MRIQQLEWRRGTGERPSYATERGRSHPLGAHPDEAGVNFAVFSEHAVAVTLLLFDRADGLEPFQTITLDPERNRSFAIWHVYVRGPARARVLRAARGRPGRTAGPAEGVPVRRGEGAHRPVQPGAGPDPVAARPRVPTGRQPCDIP